MQQMDLDAAAEERLREAAEMDRFIKTTMLPYETELAQAKIGLTLAQKDYAASRASRAADDASALSVFERSPNDRSQILRILGLDDDEVDISPEIRSGGGGASILDATPPTGGDFESFGLGSASTTKNNPIVAEFSPKEEEETGPLYNLRENKTLLASSDSFGVPDTGGQDNLKSLTAASALTPKEEGPTMRNAADWDEDNTNFSPLEKKNPLTSLEIPEDKRKEIERLNDETGALNKNQDQAAPTSEEDMGAYLVKGLNQLEKAKDRAQLAQSGPEKRFVSGIALKLEDLTYREAAKKLGIDPDMGEYAVKALTRSGVNGMRRSPSQINQIVDLVKGGMDITEASTFFDAKARKELENKLNGKTSGGAEEITRWQGVMKNTLDAEGNVMPDRMGEYEKAASEIDRLTGAPTGVSKFASRYNSKQDRISKMTAAMDSGIPYKGLAAEQIPSEILKLNQETVELAVENAPYFGSNDREAAAKWITDPATKGLPFRSDYEGKKIPHFVTSEPGVYNIWSPKEKTWMVVDKRKPNPETATAPETDNSQFSEAGKTGQKIRKAGGGLVRAVKGASTAVGEKISNIPAGAANAGASIVEAGAGVFNIPLKIPRASSISESLEKMGLKKYDDGTWGPSNK